MASYNSAAATNNNEEEPVSEEEDQESAVADASNNVGGEGDRNGEGIVPTEGDADEVEENAQDTISKETVEGDSDAAIAEQIPDRGATLQNAGDVEKDQDDPNVVRNQEPPPPSITTLERTETAAEDSAEGLLVENREDVDSTGGLNGMREEREFDFHTGMIEQPNLYNTDKILDRNDSAYWQGVKESFDTNDAARPTLDLGSFMPQTSFTNQPPPPTWSTDSPSDPATQQDPALGSCPMPMLDDDEELPDDGPELFLPQMEDSPPPPSQIRPFSSRHETGRTHEVLESFDAFDVTDEDAGAEKREREDDPEPDESGRPSKASKASD